MNYPTTCPKCQSRLVDGFKKSYACGAGWSNKPEGVFTPCDKGNCSAHVHNGIGEVSLSDLPLKWCGRLTEVCVSKSEYNTVPCWLLAINKDTKIFLATQEEAESIYRILSKGIL